ncbi:hypothetical protein [Actinacidiphila guanduensis]|uniref:Uncharacterized protein n=1 Tax=Actinacidiphila guanduensis TaxID=310781 RepID=A0A1H0C6Q1_9ACTN|nr:hypothetical protein [Actinacidiphila guanduensis]SDN53506.1 hypothetical protein SAMN05216259_104440 [Actinacidiphila guanduensis]
MAKKQAPLPNRLARLATRLSRSTTVAVLRPADHRRPLADVCWDVLDGQPGVTLAVSGPGDLAERLARHPSFTTAEADGWITGTLLTDLASAAGPPAGDPQADAVEQEVLAALGPDARWQTNSTHPRASPSGRSWDVVTTATFDLLVTARGPAYDLVLLRSQDD